VTFFHDDRPVFSTRASKPRLVLPSSFRYAAGRYRWTVRATPTGAGAKPIVDATFVLTKAAAAAANRR